MTYTFRGDSDRYGCTSATTCGGGSYLPWSAVPGLPTDSCVTSVV